MADQSPAQSERELPVARYEGWYTRLGCEACGEMFEIEDDVSNGQIVECDACGAENLLNRLGGRSDGP